MPPPAVPAAALADPAATTRSAVTLLAFASFFSGAALRICDGLLPRLAADFSAAPSRTNGGLIGPLRYDELAPAFPKVIDGMAIDKAIAPKIFFMSVSVKSKRKRRLHATRGGGVASSAGAPVRNVRSAAIGPLPTIGLVNGAAAGVTATAMHIAPQHAMSSDPS